MNKEQYAGMLKEIADTHKQGGDVSACVAKYNEQLSKFTEEFLVSEAMKMSDREYEHYVEKKHARAEGLEEGRAEGRAEGRVEGRAEGRAEGRSEGETKGHADAISVLQDMGLSPEQIAEAKARLAALSGK